jgi:exopolyphosphatase/guanosine-5'-triphosphate,3'-diphosphate pyrophosphatase
MNRAAAIDLGANTVRIIVAGPEGEPFSTLYSGQVITRLSAGLGQTGRLEMAAMKRTVEGVAGLLKAAEPFGPFNLVIAAASAGRDASNAAELDAMLRGAVGHGLTVISWETEARLALKGARLVVEDGEKGFILFDIGGGSTEFIHSKRKGRAAAAGTNLGVVRLSENYLSKTPIADYEYLRMLKEIEEKVDAALTALAPDGGETMVGTAGTVTAMAALDLELDEYNASMINNHKLRLKRVEDMRLKLSAMTREDLSRMGPLKGGREDLIIPGIAMVEAVMKRAGVDHVVVSDYGLREGLIMEMIKFGSIA